jgi:hypothetical protein
MPTPPTLYQVSCVTPDTTEVLQVDRTTALDVLLFLVYQAGLRHQEVLVHARPSLMMGDRGWIPLVALEPQGTPIEEAP